MTATLNLNLLPRAALQAVNDQSSAKDQLPPRSDQLETLFEFRHDL